MEDKEMNEIDLKELSRLVREGFTSGRLNNGEGKYIAWELKTEVWNEEDESKEVKE